MTPSESNIGPGQGRAEDDEYALRTEPDLPPAGQNAGSNCDLDDRERLVEQAAAEEETAPQSAGGATLRRLFFSGTFGFPFSLGVLAQTLSLIFAAFILVPVIKMALWFGSAGVGSFAGAGVAIGSMFMCALGGICLLAWIVLASAWGLTILRDTSYGGETIESWPNLLALEGIAESVYLLAGVIMAAVPGSMAIPLCNWLGIPGVWVVAVSELVLFPVFLLSLLENATPLNPFAPAIWRSVFSQWRAWGLFYAIVLGLAGVVVLTDFGSRFAGLFWNAMATGFLLGAGCVFYFRLLGRLAWHCSLSWADEESDESACEEDGG